MQLFLGPDARQVKINGGPQVAMALLAPLADLVLDGSAGDFYGGITAHSVTCKGQGKVHYDEALGEDDLQNTPLEVLSWQRF